MQTLDESLKVRNSVFGREQNIPAYISRDQIDANFIKFLSLQEKRQINNSRYIAIRLEKTGEIIGTGRVDVQSNYFKGGTWGCMKYIAVREEYCSAEVGRLIVEKLEMEAMRLHPKLNGLYLNSHTFGTSFYRKLGYIVHEEEMIKVAGTSFVLCEKPFPNEYGIETEDSLKPLYNRIIMELSDY